MDIGNEPVGARLARFLRRRGTETPDSEYGAALEQQYNDALNPQGRNPSGSTATPSGQAGNRSMRQTLRGEPGSNPPIGVDARRGRGAFAGEVNEPEPVLSRANADQENPAPSVSGRGRTGEVNEVMRSRAASRGARLPNTRMSPCAARGSEMSADDLNAMSLSRGVGADNSPDTTAAANIRRRLAEMGQGMKKGGAVKKMAKGGMVKAVSASRRGDGCASKGKTKGRMV